MPARRRRSVNSECHTGGFFGDGGIFCHVSAAFTSLTPPNVTGMTIMEK